ncbi:hypothetical protein GCM10027097_41740 [Amycolatopsis acidiphila]
MEICTPCTVVWRSRLMSLIITVMFEPAKLQMNCARASGTSTARSEPDVEGSAIRESCCTPPAGGSPGKEGVRLDGRDEPEAPDFNGRTGFSPIAGEMP